MSSSNSIYIGLIVISPLTNQKRYEAALNEILQYLSTHQQDLNIQVHPNRFVSFQPVNTPTTDPIYLPLSPFYLHTSYFRLHSGVQFQEIDKKFANIAWEVLNILKENFPSKFYLHQENMDNQEQDNQDWSHDMQRQQPKQQHWFQQLSQSEELRRQVSCLLSIKDEERNLSVDELEDAWFTLSYAEKVGDIKSQNVCLDIINQYSTVHTLHQIKPQLDESTLQRIIDKNQFSQLTSNKILAQNILNKIGGNYGDGKGNMDETLQRQITDLDGELSCQSDSMQQTSSHPLPSPLSPHHHQHHHLHNQPPLPSSSSYEKPTSTRMCLFQLSESNDLARVSLILDTLSQRSKETLHSMRKKYALNSKIITILRKYCNGDYGFDQQTSQAGTFQYSLVKLMIVMAAEFGVFLEYLQSQAIDFLCQIIEESVIFAYEEALSGDHLRLPSLPTSRPSSQHKLQKFLQLSLNLMELGISKEFQEYFPAIRDNLRKIQARICKLLSKKDNAMLNYFIQQYNTEKSELITNPSLHPSQMNPLLLQADQLSDLKSVSEPLYIFAAKLVELQQHVEALSDFSEVYSEKHTRLFWKVLSIEKNNRVDKIGEDKGKNQQIVRNEAFNIQNQEGFDDTQDDTESRVEDREVDKYGGKYMVPGRDDVNIRQRETNDKRIVKFCDNKSPHYQSCQQEKSYIDKRQQPTKLPDLQLPEWDQQQPFAKQVSSQQNKKKNLYPDKENLEPHYSPYSVQQQMPQQIESKIASYKHLLDKRQTSYRDKVDEGKRNLDTFGDQYDYQSREYNYNS